MPDFFINSLAEAIFSLTDTEVLTSKSLGYFDNFLHAVVS